MSQQIRHDWAGLMTSTTWQGFTIQFSILLFIYACTTRLLSGSRYTSDASATQRVRRVPILPYWLPYLGHLIPLTYNPSSFFRKCSKKVDSGIFSLNIWGVQHYILSHKSLLESLFEAPHAAIGYDSVRWHLLVNVFGAKSSLKQEWSRVRSDAQECVSNGLLHPPEISEFANTTIKAIENFTPDLISFSESLVDQSRWERMANATLASDAPSDTESMEVDLFALLRNFVGQVTLPSLVGSEFLEVYPAALDDLWDLDGGWKSLILGLPRFLPLPSLAATHIARKNLLEGIGSYQEALDKVSAGEEPKQPWIELQDVGRLMRARSAVWRAHGTPANIKGPADLSLIWAMSTKPSYLIFWMLLHISADPDLVRQIRDETAPYAKATQPPQTLPLAEPPRLEINRDGLVKSCPLLKACFYECIRLYSNPTSVRSVVKNTEVRTASSSNQAYVLESGGIVAASLGLHHFDPEVFDSPNTFRPSRFLPQSGSTDSNKSADGDKIKPWGVGSFACPGRLYAERMVLALTAGILAMWEIGSVDGGSWGVPEQRGRFVVSVPSQDIRVRIRARRLAS